MSKRILIVNADDCNLTPGVTQAILDCHDRGIVTSTTFMINLPLTTKTIQAVKKRKRLGVGIHLNVTLGRPVSRASQVESLTQRDGSFRKLNEQLSSLPKLSELKTEYANQVRLFQKKFGMLPTHLDTHHQVHDHPLFYRAFSEVAGQFHLPVRRSKLDLLANGKHSQDVRRVRIPDFIFGNLSKEYYWRPLVLETILRNLPEGVSEIMCHPGTVDRDLRSISSFLEGRESERTLFSSPRIKQLAQSQGLVLSHFGLCYTHI